MSLHQATTTTTKTYVVCTIDNNFIYMIYLSSIDYIHFTYKHTGQIN